jgi:hypothetical protein
MMNLLVKVTDDLIVDAGKVAEQGDSYKISPPKQSIFNQLTDWLLCQPDPKIGFNHWALGIGTTALCLRWGTYLSVLMDETKPVDPRARNSKVSMISNGEMKRINIEASSNLACLLNMMHEDEFKALDLIQRAYEALPMPQKRVQREWQVYQIMLASMMAMQFSNLSEASERSAIAVSNPYRSLANTIISLSYRNGPVEDVHAGLEVAYRLTHRRFTNSQIRTVLRFSAERLSGIMGASPFWEDDLPEVAPWPQRLSALPKLVHYPSNWSMTAESSSITLKKEWTK